MVKHDLKHAPAKLHTFTDDTLHIGVLQYNHKHVLYKTTLSASADAELVW